MNVVQSWIRGDVDWQILSSRAKVWAPCFAGALFGAGWCDVFPTPPHPSLTIRVPAKAYPLWAHCLCAGPNPLDCERLRVTSVASNLQRCRAATLQTHGAVRNGFAGGHG